MRHYLAGVTLRKVQESSPGLPKPFGKYLLLKQLAVGGMAEVYLAQQSGPAGFQKRCVIKRILPHLAADPHFLQMFLEEARIAARLSHPNIVQIYELGQLANKNTPRPDGRRSGGDYFLAMEHVNGVDLQQIEDAQSARGGRVPLPIALRIISNVAEGLEHAHRATDGGKPLGLVHRDVTPSNVVVSFDGVAKILDFGIAKAMAKTGQTEIGVVKGKLPYMSPEQVQGERLDGRSDLFSLGTVLYEFTLGRKPFNGDSAAHLAVQILQEEPPAPAALVDRFPQALSGILKKALAKHPRERYASARELQTAIDEFLLASSVRCTSHDVARYLEQLFPGMRDRMEREGSVKSNFDDEENTLMDSTFQSDDVTAPNAVAQAVVGELSAANGFEESRRNLSGGSRYMTAIMVLLVVAVAIGFWALRSKVAPAEVQAAPRVAPTERSVPPSPTPAVVAPASPPLQTTVTPASAAPIVVAPVAKPVVAVHEAPVMAAKQTIAAPVTPAPVARPAHTHTASHHTTAAEPERALPRLPTPPPSDDAP